MTGERMLRLLIIMVAALVALGSVTIAERALAAEQRFAPRPSEAYEDFTPLREPRANVPVGALWVQGYGPHGAGASTDNLETIRGVNGLTISRNLQLSLTLGLFDFLGIDPGLRNQVSARFSDLSIVRVRDLSRLDGPAGEPRILEALKAGSVTITTDRNLSLNLNGGGLGQFLPIDGRGVAGHSRGGSLEARDMYIALRVVTPSKVHPHKRELEFSRNGVASVSLDEYRVQISAVALRDCLGSSATAEAAAQCGRDRPLVVTLARPSAGNRDVTSTRTGEWKVGDEPLRIELPVPLSDGLGGLLQELQVQPVLSFEEVPGRERDGFRLGETTQVRVVLVGTALVPLRAPNGWNW